MDVPNTFTLNIVGVATQDLKVHMHADAQMVLPDVGMLVPKRVFV